MGRLEEIAERTKKLNASRSMQIAAGHVVADYTYLLERVSELEEFKEGMFKEFHDAEAELARGLGYKYDEDYGWVTGEHTTVTLAMEAARRIEELEAENERFKRQIAKMYHGDEIEPMDVQISWLE